MQPIRQLLDDAPDFFPIPQELRHHRVEIILWPLDEQQAQTDTPVKPRFSIADVATIDIPSREERNARQ